MGILDKKNLVQTVVDRTKEQQSKNTSLTPNKTLPTK